MWRRLVAPSELDQRGGRVEGRDRANGLCIGTARELGGLDGVVDRALELAGGERDVGEIRQRWHRRLAGGTADAKRFFVERERSGIVVPHRHHLAELAKRGGEP